MGGKNLCVTNQHNASSINVQKHHISLNNGDQTTTVLSPANSSQSTETIKTNVKVSFYLAIIINLFVLMYVLTYENLQSGKTAVVSVVATHLRHDVLDKNKVLSQLFNSPVLNSESKTVIPSINAHLPKEECNSDADTTNRKSSQKSDTVITFTTEEKQCRFVYLYSAIYIMDNIFIRYIRYNIFVRIYIES